MVRRKCKLVELIIIWYIEITGWIESCLFMFLRLTAVILKEKKTMIFAVGFTDQMLHMVSCIKSKRLV